MTTIFNPKTDINEIRRSTSLLYQPGDVVELRALDLNGNPHAGYFNDFTKLANEAARLSGTMMGVYLVLNPIKKELLARAVNRIVDKPKNLTTDADIISRRWFPIDVDAERATGISSTNEEHEAAIFIAKNIKAYLVSVGFSASSIVIGDSGNGAHVLVRIDIPNDTSSKSLIEASIDALKSKFDSDKVTIDKSVFNAARIWKCYGTICKKGDSTDDRPHRTANLLEVPTEVVIAPIAALKALAATAPQPETLAAKTTYCTNGQEFDLETWMSTHDIEVTKKKSYNGGTKYILRSCPFDSNHNGTSAALFKMANGAIVYKCQHNGCVDNDWRKLREMKEPEYANRNQEHRYKQAEHGTEHRHLTDMGNAERLKDKYGDKIRYNYERKLWLIWTGKYWKWDDGSEIMRLAQKTARSIYGEIAAEDDEDAVKAKAKWAAVSEGNQRLCAMIAQAEPMLSITLDDLDRDEWLLNCKNGTINLKTGKLQLHNPADLITRVIDTEFDPNAASDEWVKFLNRIFDNKADLIAFIQRALGYSITGNQGEQAIFFCNGSGWNGKSTLLGVIRKILMEYSAEVEPSAFMVDKNRGTGPNEAIASLYKVNFCSSTEIEDGQKLSTSLLKRMTGGESLRCERKFEHGFNFRPQYKLWLCGNHEPEISDTTNSIWNRLKKIPFIVRINAEERVKDYDTKLVAEHGPAILAWLVKGCLEWQCVGLGESPEVQAATQAYRDNQDPLHDFLKDNFLITASETEEVAKTYTTFSEWSTANGDKYFLGKRKFNERMSEKGFVKVPGAGNKLVWRGLRLYTNEEKVNLVSEKSGSSLHEDIQLKLTGKEVTKITKLTTLEAKQPKTLATLDEKCPVCGSDELGLLPDGSGYYCTVCYPVEDNADD
jgi:P4 family phage/plasmid primase-like protien